MYPTGAFLYSAVPLPNGGHNRLERNVKEYKSYDCWVYNFILKVTFSESTKQKIKAATDNFIAELCFKEQPEPEIFQTICIPAAFAALGRRKMHVFYFKTKIFIE